MSDWMFDHKKPENMPVVEEILKRVKDLNLFGALVQPSHALGVVILPDGSAVNAHVVHAVETMITDGELVAIMDRKNPPRQGKAALPGGLLEYTLNGELESEIAGARREAKEEIGLYPVQRGVLLGVRNFERRHDIRIVKGDKLQKYGMKSGDLFLVSTRAVLFVDTHLQRRKLVAGSDAIRGSARLLSVGKAGDELSTLHAETVALALRKFRCAA